MTLTVKTVNFGINVGDSVPPQNPDDLGNVGRYIETIIKNNGVFVNSSYGIDIPDLKMEVKTRNDNASSPFTICRMSIDEVINTSYENSRVYQSIENLLIIRYNDILNVITSVEVHNWANCPLVNDIFRQSYESARKKFQNNQYGNTIRGKSCMGYFEISRNIDAEDVYQFRLSSKDLKKLELTKKKPALKLFEFV